MRLVREHQGEYPTRWAAITSIASKMRAERRATIRQTNARRRCASGAPDDAAAVLLFLPAGTELLERRGVDSCIGMDDADAASDTGVHRSGWVYLRDLDLLPALQARHVVPVHVEAWALRRPAPRASGNERLDPAEGRMWC